MIGKPGPESASLGNSYLALQSVALTPSSHWIPPGQGLAFVFPTGGSGQFCCGAATQTLRQGDALVLSQDRNGRVQSDSQHSLTFKFFTVSFEGLYPLFAGNELHLVSSLEDRLKCARWWQAPASVAANCHKLLPEVPAHVNLEHRGHLLRIAVTMLSDQLELARPAAGGYVRMEDHLCQVFEKLSLDELLHLSVGELALRFGCSRRHLNRLFHQHFGMPVATLRMELRLLKAVSLLRDPSAKVINVAEQCGFNHLGLFGTCFRRRFGMSPGEWRKHSADPIPQPATGLLKHIACDIADNGLCPWQCQPTKGTRLLPQVQVSRSLNGSAHPARARAKTGLPLELAQFGK